MIFHTISFISINFKAPRVLDFLKILEKTLYVCMEHHHEFTLISSEVDGKKITGPTPNVDVEPLDSLDSLQQVTPPLSILPQEQTTSPPQSALSSQQPSDGYTNISAATASVFPDDRAPRGLSEFESANGPPPGSISPMVLPDEMLSLWTPPNRFACQQQQTLPPPSESREESLLHREPQEGPTHAVNTQKVGGDIGDTLKSFETFPEALLFQSKAEPKLSTPEQLKEPAQSSAAHDNAASDKTSLQPDTSPAETQPSMPTAAQEDAASNRTTLQPDTTPPHIQLSMPTSSTQQLANLQQPVTNAAATRDESLVLVVPLLTESTASSVTGPPHLPPKMVKRSEHQKPVTATPT